MADWCNGSGSKTASAKISEGIGEFVGILIATDGTNAVTLDIYDSKVTAAGTKLIPTLTIPSSATNRMFQLQFSPGIKYSVGIYVTISVAGGGTFAYIVYHR